VFNQILRLSKHSIIYGLGVAAGQFVGFLLIPLYTRYLTPDDYGVLQVFQVTIAIVFVILVMGLTTALFRSYFAYEDEDKRRAVVSTVFVFLTIVSAVVTILLIALSGVFSSGFFNSGDYTYYFQLSFITVFCEIGIVIGLTVLRAREESTKYAMLTVIRLVVGITLNIIFVVALGKGVLGILQGTLIAAAVTYILLLATVIRKSGWTLSLYELKKMLAFGLPLVPANLASWIITMADRYFLQFMSTPDELGLYSLGYRFGLVINAILVVPFSLAWTPFLYSVAKEEKAKETYSRVLTYFLFVASFFVLALSVLSKEVIAIMATPVFYDAHKVIPLIATAYLLSGCLIVFNVGILLQAKTKFLPFLVGGAAVLNLGLNYLLIPDHGMMGAAIASVISYLLMLIGSFFISRKYYRIDYDWGRVAKILLVAGAIYAGGSFITHDSAYIAGIFKILALLTYPFLLCFIRFYQPEEIEKGKLVIRALPGYLRQRIAR
jgi:O-antigen/teichoic acid export membrane protein